MEWTLVESGIACRMLCLRFTVRIPILCAFIFCFFQVRTCTYRVHTKYSPSTYRYILAKVLRALGEMWHSKINQEFGATSSELQVSAHKRMKIELLVKLMASLLTGVLLWFAHSGSRIEHNIFVKRRNYVDIIWISSLTLTKSMQVFFSEDLTWTAGHLDCWCPEAEYSMS